MLRDLYAFDENPACDNTFRTHVDNELDILFSSSNECNSNTPCKVSIDQVHSALKSTNRNKAPGADNICYEHLLFGGTLIRKVLVKLFSAMLEMSYIPLGMKRGIIITLFKGGNKNRKDPNNYRAITLTSCISKIFEKILLERMQATVSLRPHHLQGGFQQGLGCLMSSFCLRECIHFAKENGSRLYVCYLDCKQAFDRVWINGLFYKLSTYGLDRKILQCLFNLYSGLYSSVRHKSITSVDMFPVLQSVRQGGDNQSISLLDLH